MQRNTQQLREDIDRILAGMGNTGQEDGENQDQREPDTAIPYDRAQEDPLIIHVHDYTDARVIDLPEGYLVIPKTEPDEGAGVIDTTLAGAPAPQEVEPPQGSAYRGSWLAYAPVSIVLLLVFTSFLHVLLFPPIAHITLILRSQEVHATATLQTGRILAPLTLSQSVAVPTTGRGHQDPKQATGTITFYNGQLNSAFIPSGTALTGQDGVQIVTTQDATIPPGNPGTGYGAVTVTAQAINSGTQGNIPARDINAGCCATAVLAVNLTPFSGGQDKRDFSFVTKSDIENAATPLKAALVQSVTAALQTQLSGQEQLATFPCAPQVSADHQVNDEAAQVKVTATLTCSAAAYSQTTLEQQATKLLTAQALKTVGPGFILYGATQITISHAIPTRPTPTLVLSLSGIWTYTLSSSQQQHIKDLVKGKTYREALSILRSLPGIEKVSLAWDENAKLPRDTKDIHVLLISGI